MKLNRILKYAAVSALVVSTGDMTMGCTDNFENLNNTPLDEVYVSGLRTFDMAVRLKTAGISPSKFVIEEEYEKLTEQIKNGKNKKIYILATYTAMINYRKYLHSKGYIKKLW